MSVIAVTRNIENKVEDSIISKIGTSLGKGACRILNSYNEKNDSFKEHWYAKQNMDMPLTVKDHVMHGVFGIGNTVKSIGKVIGKGTSSILKSDAVKTIGVTAGNYYSSIKEAISKGFNESTLKLQQTDAKDRDSFSYKFKSFMNVIGRSVGAAYLFGEKVVGHTVDRVSQIKDEIKTGVENSTEYKKLTKFDQLKDQRDKMDNKDAEDKGVEVVMKDVDMDKKVDWNILL